MRMTRHSILSLAVCFGISACDPSDATTTEATTALTCVDGPDADDDGVCDDADICSSGDDSEDSDSDGEPNACDVCPNDASLQTFNWVVWDTPITGSSATGTVGNTSIEYTSSASLQITTDLFFHGNFPASFNVPNVNPTIRNDTTTTNVLAFDRPVSDPLLVFASVGNGGTAVPVNFDNPIVLEFQQGVTNVTDTSFTGVEGFAVVRVPGVHSSITFEYTAVEYYANFVFGFGGTFDDGDGDGVPDVCDLCPLDNPDDGNDNDQCDSDEGTDTNYLILTESSYDADFGPRADADELCADAIAVDYPTRTCTHGVHAFVSFDADDEVRDMPDLYDVDTSYAIYDGSGETKIADSWEDLMDGDIDAAIGAEYWSGTQASDYTTYGGVGASTCNGWTSNESGQGLIGDASLTGEYWSGSDEVSCTGSYPVLCLCMD